MPETLALITLLDQGDEIGGRTTYRGLRTKALMRSLGTRLECRQTVFVGTEKLYGNSPFMGEKSIVAQPDSNLNSPAHDCAIATTCDIVVRLRFLSQTDISFIIIITYRPRLPLLKPE